MVFWTLTPKKELEPAFKLKVIKESRKSSVKKKFTQPITKVCLFWKQCLFKSVTVFVHAFSCLFSSHAYFQTGAYYRASKVFGMKR